MFKILKSSAPSLHQKCASVASPYSKDDIDLVLKMHEYVKYSQIPENKVRAGVGLAAPQIGINKRMLAIYYQKEDVFVSYALINPKVLATSVKMCCLENGEGCLSVETDVEGYVYRPYKVTVEAFDALKNEIITIVARGYDAIVLQHELDHLEGILYFDRINKNDPFKIIENSITI